MSANSDAFLQTLSECEGTNGPDGYGALFGYTPSNNKVFTDFSTHPNIRTLFLDPRTGKANYTTAAGRYQIIHPTFVRLSIKLGTTDFSPETQDAMGLELIDEQDATDSIEVGSLRIALDRCAPIWASLPASTAKQNPRSYTFALNAYLKAGGSIA